jgi:rhamnose utilization protein RhaD (predicted bifunctional aldolase and dehydrogenase)/NAD(P)-dependent dehydrogenase (short-subunit alcohol dehydrogenase family)
METLITLSRFYGSDPEFVLAGGGNTSVKIGDRLFVKGSGTALAVIDERGFVEMDRIALDQLLASDLGPDPAAREEAFKNAIMAARLHPERGQRPSVECVLHNLLPAQFIVHTHATRVNMLTCAKEAETLAQQIFGDEALWVPYVDPGFTLAKVLDDALKAWQKRTGRKVPPAVLMANHGLIISGDTAEEIADNTASTFEKLNVKLDALPAQDVFGAVAALAPDVRRPLINTIAPALRALLAEEGGPLKVVTVDDSELTLSLVAATDGQTIAAGGPLIPDQIVYCKSFPLWFEPVADETETETIARLREAIARHVKTTRFAPHVVLVRGVGLFAAGKDWKAADIVRQVYQDAIKVMGGAKRLSAINYMTERERVFIEDWEVESYRQKVAAGGARAGRVAGRIAIVTGAAQGFGLEIAQHLAAEGAHVVLTDINADGAQHAAAQLVAEYGTGRAQGLAVNVGSGESVAAMIHEVVRNYGGFDLFVSNAGVLRAGSVKTQAEKDFDFTTLVNYKGYFLCVQNASPILSTQHAARPEYWSDIIQINSKSGLQGSNKNGAYAGSKFGSIGLTQSFAMELVTDGIKVNSICPGNFFDGPLWSDPQTGLFVQYLNTGKVPGAKSIADVKKFYEAKVPMGRGCTTPDVMKAIYYLVDQLYETGQAVPVTGGQVMLK